MTSEAKNYVASEQTKTCFFDDLLNCRGVKSSE